MMEGYYARSKQELQKWVDEQREIIRKTGIDVMGDFEKNPVADGQGCIGRVHIPI